MKKLIPVLAMIMLVPFVICSCFVQQAKSMKLSYEEIEFHVANFNEHTKCYVHYLLGCKCYSLSNSTHIWHFCPLLYN